jgi:hypothetical protein
MIKQGKSKDKMVWVMNECMALSQEDTRKGEKVQRSFFGDFCVVPWYQ